MIKLFKVWKFQFLDKGFNNCGKILADSNEDRCSKITSSLTF